MNQERIFQIIRAPHISEKSAVLGDVANQAVFQVAMDAKKRKSRQRSSSCLTSRLPMCVLRHHEGQDQAPGRTPR